MTNEMQLFNFEGNDVRTILVGEDTYYIGKDVASALLYSDPTKATRVHVEGEDKIMGGQDGSPSIIDSMGRIQRPTLINESGVWSLVLDASRQSKSDTVRDKAKQFKHWLTSEVLPSIRKNGGYLTPEKAYEFMQDPRHMIDFLTKFADTKDALDQANERLVEAQPKVDYYQNILSTPNLVPVTLISKDYGMTPQKFNTLLNDLHIQYKKCGTVWTLYSEYDSEGYTQTLTYYHPYSGQSSQSTKWTQKGRVFLYNTLKEHGILPTLERQQLENKQTQTA